MKYYYYVLTDPQDPGSEHETYEEAQAACLLLQKKGLPARIFGGPNDLGFHDPWPFFEDEE